MGAANKETMEDVEDKFASIHNYVKLEELIEELQEMPKSE